MSNKKTEYTIQYLENLSADISVSPPILRRGTLVKGSDGNYYPQIGSSQGEMLTSSISRWNFNNYIESGSTTYVGYQDSDGDWMIRKIVFSDNSIASTYATIKNNASYTSYASSWSDRESLSYDTYYEAID